MSTSAPPTASRPRLRAAAKASVDCFRVLARTLRRLPERVLHPLRRRVARNALRKQGLPRLTLVVCHGNICRSPYAAGALRNLVVHGRVVSAGFIGVDRPSPPEAVSVATAHSVDLSRHRSKLLLASEVEAADLIVVMDAAQRRAIRRAHGGRRRGIVVLGDLDPLPIKIRAIRDPLDQPREVFEETFSRIDRCLHELVRTLGSEESRRAERAVADE